MLESRLVGINRDVAGSSPASGANLFVGGVLRYQDGAILRFVLIHRDGAKPYMFWVYILENPAGRFYIGQTDNLETRLANHNRTDKTDGKYARKNGPWKLVWSENHPTRSAAMQRERQIKSMKSAKWIREHLLNGRVPTRRD